MMHGHEFERLEFYMTNTSLSVDYNDVGNEVPEMTFASRDSKQLAWGVPETSGGTG